MKNFRKILSAFTVLLLCTVFFYACEEEPTEKAKSEIVFSLGKKAIDSDAGKAAGGAEATEEKTPRAIVVTVVDSEGNVKYNLKKLELFSFGDSYLTEGVSLEVGNYQIADFFVVDEDNDIISMTPKQGSKFAYLVDTPLDYDFSVVQDQETQVSLEVVKTNCFECTAVDFGYSETFKFNVVDCPETVTTTCIYVEKDNYAKVCKANSELGLNQSTVVLEYSGSAKLEKTNTGVKVVESGTLKNLKISYIKHGTHFVDEFIFTNTGNRVSLGLHGFQLFWHKPIEYKTIKRKKRKEDDYLLAGRGWETIMFEEIRVFYHKGPAHIFPFMPLDNTVNNYRLSGEVTGIRLFLYSSISTDNGMFDFYNNFTKEFKFNFGTHSMNVHGTTSTVNNFKTEFFLSVDYLIPPNMSKLNAEGNPTEDFYGRPL